MPGQVKPATSVKVRQAVAQASHEYRPEREIDVVRAIVERGVDAIVFVGTDHFQLKV